jgi:hypothetical protein
MKVNCKLIITFLTLFMVNNIFSQEKALFINFGSPTGPVFTLPKLGIGYEKKVNEFSSYLITGYFTGNLEYVTIDYIDGGWDGWHTVFEIDLLAYYRWYPFNSSIKKLYIDIGAGLTLFLLTEKDDDTKASFLFPLQTTVGWRFGSKKYFIQPWVGYNISFGRMNYPEHFHNNELGILLKYGIPSIGLAIGFFF